MPRPPGWIGVELRHFLALEAVASEGSFHGAAAGLGYTQSAISQQIATLERAVGQKLIERPGGSQPVRLTRAGEIVVQHAHAIGARLATAQADLQSLVAGHLDPLRLGFFGCGLGALMPGICRRLEDVRPEIEIRIVEAGHDDDLVAMLRRGQVDVSFVHLPGAAEDCEQSKLLDDEHVLVVQAGSPLADRPVPPGLEELASLPLIGFKPRKSCQLTEHFRSHGLEPSWLVGSNDVETIYAFVAAGVGAALLPRLATLSFGGGVRVVPLDCGLPARHLGVAWSITRGENATAEAFATAAAAEVGQLTRTRLSLAG